MTRLGVVGWPVAHSRSPAIQNAALAAVGLEEWRYQLLPVPPALFAETVSALPVAGFRGVNVTIPHKHAAIALASEATPRARAIGAANTLTFEAPAGAKLGSRSGPESAWIHADNTDAPALIAALPLAPAGKTALVLGAGGSARAAVWALLDAGAGEVRVWNRTPDRARRLCAQLGGTPVSAAAPADILVHCTPIGLDHGPERVEELPIAIAQLDSYRCVVDFVYASGDTALIAAARAQGIPFLDGLELLVRQGALSFERFTGRPAPLEAMRAAVGR